MTHYDDLTPTGIWSEAIRHIREAQVLMMHMECEAPWSPGMTLAKVFDRQLDTVVGSIDQHYRHRYMEIATRRPRMVLRDDGTIEPLP